MAKGKAKRVTSAGKRSGSVKKSALKIAKKPEPKAAKTKPKKTLPGSFRHTWRTLLLLRRFWRPLSGAVVIFLILNVFFVGGLGNIHSQVNEIKERLDSSSGSKLSDAIDSFASLVTGTNASADASSLQTVLIVLASLVFIWTLRQLVAGEKVSLKQSFYHSMAPLIPFLLVMALIIVQLLPLIIALVVLSIVLSGLVSSTPILAVGLSLIFALLAGWSLYMLSSSIFALYIVTLPDIQPLQALRSAKNLTSHKRWQIVRRILFLPIFILLALALILIPLIYYAIFLVTPVLFVSTVLILLFTHAYFYGLYRRLLNE